MIVDFESGVGTNLDVLRHHFLDRDVRVTTSRHGPPVEGRLVSVLLGSTPFPARGIVVRRAGSGALAVDAFVPVVSVRRVEHADELASDRS